MDNSLEVFFYGLFMDEDLLTSMGVRPGGSRRGYVDGFSLYIGERATLLPEQGGRSYGVLVELDAKEAASLYSAEGLRDYAPETVVVHLPNGEQVAAVSYNLPASKLTGANPKYAAALLALATKLEMPETYLARIRSAAESG